MSVIPVTPLEEEMDIEGIITKIKESCLFSHAPVCDIIIFLSCLNIVLGGECLLAIPNAFNKDLPGIVALVDVVEVENLRVPEREVQLA